jgi:uncharacterized protein YjbI with pentapeptide repeats
MIRLTNANIKKSAFDDVNMADTGFNDVNLKRLLTLPCRTPDLLM